MGNYLDKQPNYINHITEYQKKHNWSPSYDELFSTLSFNEKDKSIELFIELLKTSDFEKAFLDLNKKIFVNKEKYLNESFRKFVDYLFVDNKYKDLYAQSMNRYKIMDGEEAKQIYDEVYDNTLKEIENVLNKVKKWKDVSKFMIMQVIKLLRWDAFIFRVDNEQWFVRIEKDYLWWKEAKKIHQVKNDNLWWKPVYWLRMHVWEGAQVFNSLKFLLNKMEKFVQNVDIKAEPYIWMQSRLLDTEFFKYRLQERQKKKYKDMWKDYDMDAIDEFVDRATKKIMMPISQRILWEIELQPISDSAKYKKAREHIFKNKKDKNWKYIIDTEWEEIINSYEREWKQLQEWSCVLSLKNTNTFSK